MWVEFGYDLRWSLMCAFVVALYNAAFYVGWADASLFSLLAKKVILTDV